MRKIYISCKTRASQSSMHIQHNLYITKTKVKNNHNNENKQGQIKHLNIPTNSQITKTQLIKTKKPVYTEQNNLTVIETKNPTRYTHL